jgi:D-3-phosphoglycerate dehydrogenase
LTADAVTARRRFARGAILITDSDLGDPDIERSIAAEAGYEIVVASCRTERDVIEAIRRAGPCGLLVQYAPITGAALEHAPKLRAIARYGVGLDSIDLDAAARAGLAVVNVPDYATEEVADHTLALVLALLRGLPATTAATRSGAWPSGHEAVPPRDVRALTLGLAGFGRIAQAVARRLGSLGARIVVHDPLVPPDTVAAAGAEPVGWTELWDRADLVSLHMPLMDGTRGLVDDRLLGRLRPGSYIVNTARAGLIDRGALERALARGALAGVALDVWWEEPPPPDDPLLRDSRVVVTPHVAYLSAESVTRLRRYATERLIAHLNNPTRPEVAVTTEAVPSDGAAG